MPAAVRRSFQERAQKALYRECSEMLARDATPGQRGRSDDWRVSTCCSGKWVGGILYPRRVGLFLARVANRGQEEVRATTSHDELELFGGFRWRHFARIVSAKRALLAMVEAGADELAECRMVAVAGPRGVIVAYRGATHHVHQLYHGGHYASLCAERADRAEVRWDWGDRPAIDEFMS